MPIKLVLLLLVLVGSVARLRADDAMQQVDIYRQPGRFAGWPANHGIWSWGNEILVGLSLGTIKDNGWDRHAIDHDKPEEHWLARSLDGGETWKLENPAEQGDLIPQGKMLHGIAPPGLKEREWTDCPGGIDFTHPDFAMTLRMTDINQGPSRFYYSTDRGHRWQGPFRLPMFGQQGVMARTDYLVAGQHDCLLFLTASKRDGEEGRPFCARTQDGGKTWKFQGWIAPEPKGYAIMPATVRLGSGELLSVIRHRDGEPGWLDAYVSKDEGRTWEFVGKPVDFAGTGNPAALTRLPDDRVVLVYGYRAPPYEMRARISSDHGRTWGKDIVLRTGGGGTDLGYPRNALRPDGKLVSIYYFHDTQVGDRYVAATIWQP